MKAASRQKVIAQFRARRNHLEEKFNKLRNDIIVMDEEDLLNVMRLDDQFDRELNQLAQEEINTLDKL